MMVQPADRCFALVRNQALQAMPRRVGCWQTQVIVLRGRCASRNAQPFELQLPQALRH